MTDATFVTILASIPPTLTALGGVLLALRNGWKTDAVGVQATTAATKADTAVGLAAGTSAQVNDLATGQQVIHTLVNSNLTKVKSDLAEAQVKIAHLSDLVEALSIRLGPVAAAAAAAAAGHKVEPVEGHP